MIGDAPWHRLITALGRPLFRAPMRFFRAGGEHEAEQWLSTRPPTATDPRLRPPD